MNSFPWQGRQLERKERPPSFQLATSLSRSPVVAKTKPRCPPPRMPSSGAVTGQSHERPEPSEHDTFWVARKAWQGWLCTAVLGRCEPAQRGALQEHCWHSRSTALCLHLLPPLWLQISLILAACLLTLTAFPKCNFQMFTFPSFPHSNFRCFQRFRDSAT